MSTSNALFSEVLVILGGVTVAAPLFKKIGLGTVLGYLAAGIVIGPLLRVITTAEELLSVSELGVVFLLFVIGLELKPSRLWQMRRDIFGLGLAQVGLTGFVLTGAILATGLMDWKPALVAGFGLALSSTAFAMQILESEGDVNTRYGQRSFSLLLFQDLAIVPLLALTSLLDGSGSQPDANPWYDAGIALVTVFAMVLIGRYLLSRLFTIIARTGAREAMIAAALFLVLGSATLMQAVGLSMAMGAFLSGVMLAESSYRHELEADIEPFRGVLLATFFMAVGLSLDINVILDRTLLIIAAVPAMMALKAAVIYGICRLTGSPHNDAIRIAFLLPQGGEFGFVLFTTAAATGLFTGDTASLLIVIVTLSMALTPLGSALSRRLMTQAQKEEMDEDFAGAGSDVLMIGFSRFGQIASQMLLADGRDVTILDTSADRVRQAERFGFRIYFGDGTRKDMLLAAGIQKAKIVAVCTHNREVTNRIVDLVQSEFPDVRLYVRSYDRIHTLELREKGVDVEVRETLESALIFGALTLQGLGTDEATANDIRLDIRRRDDERLALQAAEGIYAGTDKLHKRPVTPEPLLKPKKVKVVEEEKV
jgi:CPA2 family monovalent cation:H+ antiporter-2